MKKRKKIVSGLMIASYLANQPINALAEDINNLQNIEQTKENSYVKAQEKSLGVVYLDGTKASSGSGETPENAVKTFKEAIDLVSDVGTIYVTGEVDIPDDVDMPSKLIYIKQQKDKAKGKLKFEKKLKLNHMLYINDIDVDFASKDKDCIFLNGNYLETTNVQITGRPNIFIGAEDKDLNTTGSLNIYNKNGFNSNPIGNINLGGKNGHTIDSVGVSIKGVNVEGTINGENVKDKSIIYVEGSSSVNNVKDIKKISVYDDVVLDIKGGLDNVRELYFEGTIRVKNGYEINSEYIYGTFTLDVDVPDNATLIEGNYVKGKNFVGNMHLSDKLTRAGYRVNKIKKEDSTEVNILNRQTTNPNYKPVIKNLSTITLQQGNTIDLKLGVKAEDFEDGDITDKIVYPEVDLKKLPVGIHEVTYKVTDSDNNTVTMKRIIKVIADVAPVIDGAKDITIKLGDVDKFNLLDGITAIDYYGNYLQVTVNGTIEKPSAGTNKNSTITYTAKDAKGRITTVTRNITVTNQVPEIKGLDNIVTKKGQPVDLLSGVTASDLEDGDVTNKIVKTGDVNINKDGTYKITYTVTDNDGNTTQLERSVVVEKDDEVVPPIEELPPTLPPSLPPALPPSLKPILPPTLQPVISEAITNNLISVNSGTGEISAPVEIEFNNISNDKADALLDNIKNMDMTVNGLQEKDGYTFVTISILRDSNYGTFKTFDVDGEKVYVVLKVKNEYTNIVNRLKEFAGNTDNTAEDSKDDSTSGDVNNNAGNNVGGDANNNTDDNINEDSNNNVDNNINQDDSINNNPGNNTDNNINGNPGNNTNDNINNNDNLNTNDNVNNGGNINTNVGNNISNNTNNNDKLNNDLVNNTEVAINNSDNLNNNTSNDTVKKDKVESNVTNNPKKDDTKDKNTTKDKANKDTVNSDKDNSKKDTSKARDYKGVGILSVLASIGLLGIILGVFRKIKK